MISSPEQLSSPSEEFLDDFRLLIAQDTSKSRGSTGTHYSGYIENIALEASQLANEQTDRIFNIIPSLQKQAEHKKQFTHNFTRSAIFIATVALRNEDEYPPFSLFLEDEEFRYDVLKTLARQTRRSGRFLSVKDEKTQKYNKTPPTTWGAVKSHIFSPEEIEEIVVNNKDLGISVIVKALKNKPGSVQSELDSIRYDIHYLSERFPGLPIHEARKARLNYPRDPETRIRTLFPGLQENVSLPDRNTHISSEGSPGVISKDERREQYIRNLEKIKDIERFNILPRYLVEHYCRSNSNIIMKLDWVLETRQQLIAEYGLSHGTDILSTALRYRDPHGFMKRFVETKTMLTQAKKDRKLSGDKIRRISGTIRFNNELVYEALKKISTHVEDKKFEELQFPNKFVIKIFQITAGKLKSHIDGVFKEIDDLASDPKTAFIGKKMIAEAVFLEDDAKQEKLLMHQQAYAKLKNIFPDTDEYLLTFAYQNSDDPENFILKANQNLEELARLDSVHILGNAFLLMAVTRFIERPKEYLDNTLSSYLSIIKQEKYISLGSRTIKICLLLNPESAIKLLDGLNMKIEYEAAQTENQHLSYVDVKNQVIDEYLLSGNI